MGISLLGQSVDHLQGAVKLSMRFMADLLRKVPRFATMHASEAWTNGGKNLIQVFYYNV